MIRLPLRVSLAALSLACLLGPTLAGQQPAATGYAAVTDRAPRPKPPVPAPGMAGSSFVDPVFGTPITRVTDRSTRPGRLDRSFRTPSGSHQNAWSLSGRHFFVVSTDGTVIPYAFDSATGRAARISPTSSDEGGMVLRFYTEPHFSYARDGVIYGAASGGSLRTIDQFDFATGGYTRLLDLDTLASGLAGTYVGGVGSSAGPSERVFAFFGGTSQDRHFLLVVFDPHNPGSRRLLNTRASTLDGRATNLRLDFQLHAVAIDRSGRFVTLYPTSADRSSQRAAAPNYQWDLATDQFIELPGIAARSNGHDAFGYGVRVNQDCCTSTTWDAAQWQLRALTSPFATDDIISPVLAPRMVYLSDHPSWHNARPDAWTPFITGLYRYGANTVEWRAWDDEIVAVQTGHRGGEVWRLAHHRSDVRHDADPTRISFWYTPRPNVSPDGRWVLFTSNWEKTLGRDPGGDASGSFRQDVFLLRLTGDAPGPGPSAPGGPVVITTTSLPDARLRRAYAVRLTATGTGSADTWRVTAGRLPPGLSLHPVTGAIGGAPRETGAFTFTVSIAGASRALVVSVR